MSILNAILIATEASWDIDFNVHKEPHDNPLRSCFLFQIFWKYFFFKVKKTWITLYIYIY